MNVPLHAQKTNIIFIRNTEDKDQAVETIFSQTILYSLYQIKIITLIDSS